MTTADKVRQAAFLALYSDVRTEGRNLRHSLSLRAISGAACDAHAGETVTDALQWVNRVMDHAAGAGWLDGLTDDELRIVAAMTHQNMRMMVTDGYLQNSATVSDGSAISAV